ncbi:BAF_collapsed_G0030660.mRNA.1.CDS.1 [Saccharomyces cerevisiae]|nr:BAF_collapsed_G0030660.mRNA.1.CDS.1 [Saccharomyces cerevisiae]
MFLFMTNIYISIFSFLSSYGLDIHIFNRFIPFHLYHKVSISFRGIIIAVSRRGTQAPTDNGKDLALLLLMKRKGFAYWYIAATKRLIDSSYEALFLSIYCLSSSKQSFVTKKKQPATDRK